MRTATKVFIIDGHAQSRNNACQAISTDPDFQIVGEAASGLDGLKKIRALRPDLILLDMHTGDMNGLETLRRIKALQPSICCIILTNSIAKRDLLAAMKADANGYLLKNMLADELCAKLKKAISGTTVVHEDLKKILIQSIIDNKPHPDTRIPVTLTKRESEILDYLTQQFTIKSIASSLGISISTVRTHINHLLVKLKLTNPLDASAWAAQKDMLRRMGCISMSPY